MSEYYREHGFRREIDWDSFRETEDDEVHKRENRTVQSFKDSCDINKMLKQAQVKGSISHLIKYPEAVYGEFDGEFDLLTAHERLNRAKEIFNDAPSEIRNEFNNNPLEFIAFANKPENKGRLAELLPLIAEPGSYFPNPVQRGGQGAGAATAPAEAAPAAANAARAPEAPPVPQGGTDGGVSPPEHVK